MLVKSLLSYKVILIDSKAEYLWVPLFQPTTNTLNQGKSNKIKNTQENKKGEKKFYIEQIRPSLQWRQIYCSHDSFLKKPLENEL